MCPGKSLPFKTNWDEYVKYVHLSKWRLRKIRQNSDQMFATFAASAVSVTPSASKRPRGKGLGERSTVLRRGVNARVMELEGSPDVTYGCGSTIGSHFGVGAPPILVYFSGDWDVHWRNGTLTHGHMGVGVWVKVTYF